MAGIDDEGLPPPTTEAAGEVMRHAPCSYMTAVASPVITAQW